MPKVCIERPNRSQKRIWTPPALTRIVRDVCEYWGIEQTEAAVFNGYCDVSSCEETAVAVKDILEVVLDVLELLVLLEIALGGVVGRVIKFLLRRFPVLNVILRLLERVIARYGSPSAGKEVVQDALEKVNALIAKSNRV